MNYRDLLDLSYDIFKKHDTEVGYRTTVSRAYYSVFYPARDLKKEHRLSASGSEHEGLVRALKSRKQFLPLGNALDMMRKERIKADYHLDNAVSARSAKAALAKAKKLHEAIDKV